MYKPDSGEGAKNVVEYLEVSRRLLRPALFAGDASVQLEELLDKLGAGAGLARQTQDLRPEKIELVRQVGEPGPLPEEQPGLRSATQVPVRVQDHPYQRGPTPGAPTHDYGLRVGLVDRVETISPLVGAEIRTSDVGPWHGASLTSRLPHLQSTSPTGTVRRARGTNSVPDHSSSVAYKVILAGLTATRGYRLYR